MSFESIIKGQGTVDADHKNSPCHYVTGELKNPVQPRIPNLVPFNLES